MEEIISSLVNRDAESIHACAEDYVKDGILYCGKCNTPKQGEYRMPWGIIKPYILCQCETMKREREEQEVKARELYERIHRNRREGFTDKTMRSWTFEADDRANEKISTLAHRYVDNFPDMRKTGKGLLLFGDVGVGKSVIVACIVNALIDKGYPCMMTNFSRLVNTLQGRFEGRQEYIDSLNRYTMLAIDDLGVERDTQAVNEIVYSVIDARERAGLPLIVTTNLSSQELKHPRNKHEERIFSRLMGMCVPVEVTGCDRRKERLKEDFGELKDLLGL